MGSKAGLYDPNPLIMCQRVSQTFECLFYWLTKPLIWMRKGHRDRETCNWVYEKKSSIQLRRNSKSCQPVRLIWLTAILSVCLVVLSVHYKDTVCNTRIYNPRYFFALSKLSLYTPAVYLCVSACAGVYVGQTARPLTALSGLPNRLLSVLHCFCLLCKKKKLLSWQQGLSVTQGSDSTAERWWKCSQLFCLSLCVFVCVKASGYICQVVAANLQRTVACTHTEHLQGVW